MAGYRHRGRRHRYGSYNPGRERALQHIEEARRLSEELGGTDEDVKRYFFSLPETDLNIVLDLYEHHHGRQAREYAQSTIKKWRSGQTTMSGMVAGRLFKLLPPVMPIRAKYELITNLWNHCGPRSKKLLRIGLNASLEDVIDVVARHIKEVVVQYKIPQNLERRFDWLAAGDSHVKQELLNHVQQMEKILVVEGVRSQLPVLLAHLRTEQGRQTHRLTQILKIGNHELELALDKTASGVSVLEPSLHRPVLSWSDGSWQWLWWLIAAAVLMLIILGRYY